MPRFDTPPLKNAFNWITLRQYRTRSRKERRNLNINDIYVGRKINNAALSDFSNPIKDILKPVIGYTNQMKGKNITGVGYEERDANRYFNPLPDTNLFGPSQ